MKMVLAGTDQNNTISDTTENKLTFRGSVLNKGSALPAAAPTKHNFKFSIKMSANPNVTGARPVSVRQWFNDTGRDWYFSQGSVRNYSDLQALLPFTYKDCVGECDMLVSPFTRLFTLTFKT